MSKNNNINNEEEIISDYKNKLTISLNNKDNIDEEIEKDKEKERQLSSQKGAMKILQLLITKKQEKEEIEKVNEENLIEKFKKARKNLEIETLTDKNILSDNNTNVYNNKNTIKVEENINDNDKNEKDFNNDIILDSERNKINKDRIYIKNTKKIPYRKFKINSNRNNQNKINEGKNEFDVVNPSEFNKFKTINNKNNIYNNINYNTNPSTIKNEIYQKAQYKKPVTPFNDNLDSENLQPLRNKRKNNYNQEDHSMMFPNNKALKSIENSFDISTVYKKRNINYKGLKESPPSPIIYSYKRPINKRRNSYEKYNSIQPSKYDINEVIKNKRNNLDMNKSQLLNNYSKNYPSLNANYSNHKTDTNLNSYDYSNKKKNNKKKYLYTSKTSNNFNNDRKNFINYNELDISNDKINYNQYNNINNNNIYNHYMKNNNDNSFYNKNNNYNSIDYFSYQSNRNRINNNYNNQSVPYINSNKNKIKNKFISNNNYESEDEEEYNFFNSHMVNNYINNNYNYYNYNEGNYNYNNINEQEGINNSISINIEDLLIFEDKLNEIIYFLKNKKEVNIQCINFWNFFFDSSLYQRIEKTFIEERDIGIIILSIKYELLSIMLCYEFSFDKKVLNKAYILMLEILELNHRNLMIICENILNKISLENQENIWVLKLNEIVKNFKKGDDKYYMNETYTQKIIYNTDKISKKIRNILLNYKTEFSPSIMTLMTKINQKNYEEINDFFREYILRNENVINPKNISKFRNKSEFISVQPPFILSPRIKPYTLVLGLDETLIYFQQINKNQGVLKLRPFLIEFLENVSQYYELILFTSQSQLYAEPIINAIEQKKKYFDFIFYRENCVIVGNDYVKDLARIGRPLDSTIIVDNVPQYYRFQKENGINIKSFWAQDPRDRALYDLIPILINIAEEELDVRDSLAKYREEIVRKISSNISMNYI